jgi:pimeloyl-ACP methyl ester carboxylesterase
MMIDFETDDGMKLTGQLNQPDSCKRGAIFVHGWADLSQDIGFLLPISKHLANQGVALLAFDNRGSGGNGTTEIFEDCVYDIGGAIRFMKNAGFEQLSLIGHSTGCQKIAHYLDFSKSRQRCIMIEPTDDAALAKRVLGNDYEVAIRLARQLVNEGRQQEIMPKWSWVGNRASAGRYLSMFSKYSQEGSIFAFSGEMKLLKSIGKQCYAILAGESECSLDPGKRLCDLRRAECFGIVIDGAGHWFDGYYDELAGAVEAEIA